MTTAIKDQTHYLSFSVHKDEDGLELEGITKTRVRKNKLREVLDRLPEGDFDVKVEIKVKRK